MWFLPVIITMYTTCNVNSAKPLVTQHMFARRSPATVGAGMRTASKGQLAVRPWTMPGSTARRVPRAPQRAVSKMTGPPLRGPKPAGVAGLISITATPEHKGLLKDTVDFSQYKSDSTSRPARGWRSQLMI